MSGQRACVALQAWPLLAREYPSLLCTFLRVLGMERSPAQVHRAMGWHGTGMICRSLWRATSAGARGMSSCTACCSALCGWP